jgi:acyl-CoA thioesterase-1
MNPIILGFADGSMFFVGLLLTTGALWLLIWEKTRMGRPALNAMVIVGVILVAASATPLPLWAYFLWIISAVSGLVLVNRAASSTRSQVLSCSVVLVATVALCVAELPNRRLPELRVPEGTTVYVLGDSISAGVGTRERCWPSVLEEMAHLRIVNLARPGATAESAIAQAKGIVHPHGIVIVEIGGNDLLGGTNASVFQGQLDTLVSALCADQHSVLLLELPLFPFQNAFGQAQRAVARKHGVTLLPKRYFARVLGTDNGTLDGLHLSQAGHDAMASTIADVLRKR